MEQCANLIEFLATATRSEVTEQFNEASEKASDLTLPGSDRVLWAKLAAMLRDVTRLY